MLVFPPSAKSLHIYIYIYILKLVQNYYHFIQKDVLSHPLPFGPVNDSQMKDI